MTMEVAFQKYRTFLEGLTAEKLHLFTEYVAPDVRFKDPFHDISGLAQMQGIFKKLFDKVKGIKFKIINHAITGRVVYFQWQLNGIVYGIPWTVEGMTSITFNEEEKVTQHIEYWDAATQIYERIPVIGEILGFFRRRISGT